MLFELLSLSLSGRLLSRLPTLLSLLLAEGGAAAGDSASAKTIFKFGLTTHFSWCQYFSICHSKLKNVLFVTWGRERDLLLAYCFIHLQKKLK